MGTGVLVRIIARSTLIKFWKKNNDAEEALKAWFAEAKRAHWKTPNQIKGQYLSASILKDGRVVFNIAGNKYRLVVAIKFDFEIVYIRFIGTHKEYNDIDALTI